MQRMELTPRLIKFKEQTIKTRPHCAFTKQLDRRLYSRVENNGYRLVILLRPINAPESIEKGKKKPLNRGFLLKNALVEINLKAWSPLSLVYQDSAPSH